MMGVPMKRRVFLLRFALFAVGLSMAPWLGEAASAQEQTFSRIVVDMKPLEARGGGAAAAILRRQLQASLQRELAGRIGRGGPTLVVRIETVHLAAFAGEGGWRSGYSPSDWLEGEVIAGHLRFPMFVTQHSGFAGAWYLPDNEARRLRTLADQFAGWVGRKV